MHFLKSTSVGKILKCLLEAGQPMSCLGSGTRCVSKELNRKKAAEGATFISDLTAL